jgi:hypothetical protein
MDWRKVILVMVMVFGMSSADIIMPAYHYVQHNLYLDNIEDYDEYQFFIFPNHMTENVTEGTSLMSTSKVPSFYKFASPHLYAVKKTDMANKTLEEYFPLALKRDESLSVIDSLPDTDPRTEIETHYTVEIKDSKLLLTEKQNDSIGHVIIEDEKNSEDVIIEDTPERGPDYYLLAVGLGIGLVLGYLAGKKL